MQHATSGSRGDVHPTRGAGRWFPSDPEVLRTGIDTYIARAQTGPVEPNLLAVLAPHAGYPFSGGVAGHAFSAVRAAHAQLAYHTIVVLGFSHRSTFRGLCLLDGDGIRSPLGVTALDREAGLQLCADSDAIRFDSAPHYGEHSAENQIPFIQVAAPGAKLVVGLYGDHDMATLAEVVDGLRTLRAEQRALVVGSTDLLHDADYDRVTRTDEVTLATIAALDTAKLAAAWAPTQQVCCGIWPVLTVMRYAAAMGCTRGRILNHCTSADIDPACRGEWVVGYGAMSFGL